MPNFPVIREDQYTATTDEQCITVILPAGDEYKALLAGMLQLPASVDNYAGPESAQAEGVAASWADSIRQIVWEGCTVPILQGWSGGNFLTGRSAGIVTGNQMTFTNVNTAFMNGYYAQTTSAVNDRHDYWVYLSPGSFVGRCLHRKTANSGIATITAYPDTGSSVSGGTMDFYNATTQESQLSSFSFTIVNGGRYSLAVAAPTKNASSTGYLLAYSYIDLHRVS